MQVFLMNKDIQVMKLEFEVNKNLFNKVIQIKNIEYSPLSIYKTYQNNKDVLTEVNKWFKGRNIPIWRDDLFYLLKRLDIKTADELLMKSYALSLSDQYWIKPCKSKLKYKDVNFFENDFGYSDFLDIGISKKKLSDLQEYIEGQFNKIVATVLSNDDGGNYLEIISTFETQLYKRIAKLVLKK